MLLLAALVTRHWQTIGINQPPVNTTIGLWKICSNSSGKSTKCRKTLVDSSHKPVLYTIRVLSILSIIMALVGILISKSSASMIIIGITMLLSCLTSFLYSSQLENYFSEYFDKLMYSKYGYSYYLQCMASVILLMAIILGCVRP